MATTKAIMAEQIYRILQGGVPSEVRARVGLPEIKAAIGNACGGLLKASHLDTVLNIDGESIPDGSMIAVYENRPVERIPGKGSPQARVQLPANPIQMPEKMGVFAVYPSGRRDEEWMPLPAGVYSFIMKDRLINPINCKCYTWGSNRFITIHDDLIGAGIDTVDIELCVADLSTLGDNDPLPVPGDMEPQLIQTVLQIFGFEVPTNKKQSDEVSPPGTKN